MFFFRFFRKTSSPPLPLMRDFSKTHQSSLNLKGGSTSHLGLLPSGKKRKPLLSIVFTTPSVPLVGDRNVALNRCALRLAGHQSPRQVVVRDGTAFLYLLLAKGNGGEGGVSCF